MGENERFNRDNLAVTGGTTSFSQLLFADDDDDENENENDAALGLNVNQIFKCSSPSGFSAEKTPKMLCFGNYPNRGTEIVFSETTRTSQKSAVTCSDSSSSASSSGNISATTTTISNKSNRKRNGSDQDSVQCTSTITTSCTVAKQRTSSKKTRTENPTTTAPAKRKEKLGERIAALQQLVSPFGKTDTASVLHEAMGYIRFLQEQVHVLCSPYLQRLPSLAEGGENGGERGEGRKDLRSRGLCLVPVECTVHVANTNGADFWSPAMASNVSSSTKQL